MKRTLFLVSLVLLLSGALAPVAWQVLTSIKTDAEITARPLVYWPGEVTLDSYRTLLERKPILTYIRNSLVIASSATALCLACAIPAAYGLTRARPRWRRLGLGTLLAVALFPPILLLFPLYEAFRTLGWLNHAPALILPYAALNLPLAVWAIESALGQIPREVDEAAALDGLSLPRRMFLLHAPLAAPGIAAAAILVLIFSWNEFLIALTFMTRDESKTITAGIASVSGSSIYEIPWGQLSAATVVATAPLMLLVLLGQRYLIAGITRGAVKG
jgi:multiple sugar transport system permease protein